VVAAVAVKAGAGLVPGSRRRMREDQRGRWVAYALIGGLATALIGPWLVLILIAAGIVELVWSGRSAGGREAGAHAWPLPLAAAAGGAGLGALCWTAFKVGALSYGGGFVIVPLMQADAVDHYHWMSDGQFLNAVALGQVTPGPVVHTVAAVGYAAAGVGGALLAAAVAFVPSFFFISLGARRFDRLRTDPRARAFLDGAGPAAIGAIIGSAIPLTLALTEAWQFGLLAAGAVLLFVGRAGVVTTLLAAGVTGAAVGLAGGPLPG
jgi:chromate transporter